MSTNIVYQTIPWRTDVENIPKDGSAVLIVSKNGRVPTSVCWSNDVPSGRWRVLYSNESFVIEQGITRWLGWEAFNKAALIYPNDLVWQFGPLQTLSTSQVIMPKDEKAQGPNHARRGIEPPLDYDAIRFWQDIYMNSIIHDNDPNLAKLLAAESLEARKKMIEGLKK